MPTLSGKTSPVGMNEWNAELIILVDSSCLFVRISQKKEEDEAEGDGRERERFVIVLCGKGKQVRSE